MEPEDRPRNFLPHKSVYDCTGHTRLFTIEILFFFCSLSRPLHSPSLLSSPSLLFSPPFSFSPPLPPLALSPLLLSCLLIFSSPHLLFSFISFPNSRYGSLREVPAYPNFIQERFERCLDLYLCPRQRKMRVHMLNLPSDTSSVFCLHFMLHLDPFDATYLYSTLCVLFRFKWILRISFPNCPNPKTYTRSQPQKLS